MLRIRGRRRSKEQRKSLQRCLPDMMLMSRSVVNTELNQLWSELPQHMRLEGSLRAYKHRSSFEQDFLLFARLDWLQVRFLLGSGELLHRSADAPQDHVSLLAVSGEMLSLVVEAIVSRDQLINSGTGLVWKVSVHSFILPVISNKLTRQRSLITDSLPLELSRCLCSSRFQPLRMAPYQFIRRCRISQLSSLKFKERASLGSLVRTTLY
jgi:hypothetical protein